MATAKILDRGQMTIPKRNQESLGLRKVNSENWKKLLQVMKSVHEQNRGVSEEEVYQDVERAVDELRQEDYERKHNENKAS